jgi:hypothetical protein
MAKVKPVVQTGRYNLRHKHVKEDETNASGKRSGRVNKARIRSRVASKAQATNRPRTRVGSRVAWTPHASITKQVQTGRYNLRHKHVNEDETNASGKRSGRVNKARVRSHVASKPQATNPRPRTRSQAAWPPQATNKSCTGSRVTSIQRVAKKPRTGCYKRQLQQAVNKSRTKKSSSKSRVTPPTRSSTGQYKVISEFDAVPDRKAWWRSYVDGLAYLADGRVLVTDSAVGSVIRLFTPSGRMSARLVDELVLDTFAAMYDVTMLDDDTAAITGTAAPGHMEGRGIQLIKVGPISLVKHDFLRTSFDPFYITAYKNGNMAVTSSMDRTLTLLTRDGHVIKSFTMDKNGKHLFDCPSYVASNIAGTTFYVINNNRHGQTNDTTQVAAVTDAGDVTFRYESELLIRPLGLSVDANDDVYVCGRVSNNIHRISPTGQLVQITDLQHPKCICFQPGSWSFAVGHGYGNALSVTLMTLE